MKTLDDLLVKYTSVNNEMMTHYERMMETGRIPSGDAEGAPKTVDEAAHGLLGMAFVCEQIINDLLEMKLELIFEEASENEEASVE